MKVRILLPTTVRFRFGLGTDVGTVQHQCKRYLYEGWTTAEWFIEGLCIRI
ncbi:hypothetical protein [Chlorogloeopsis sp. ULAP02]|uniref:hypothetical protein n=1 Tax=Chlorogloeopsis sp. ULAP02 TaxID=3107926 RepID=UPI00313689DA